MKGRPHCTPSCSLCPGWSAGHTVLGTSCRLKYSVACPYEPSELNASSRTSPHLAPRSDDGLNYLGNPQLIHAQSIVATLLVQLVLLGTAEAYRVAGEGRGVAGAGGVGGGLSSRGRGRFPRCGI